MSNALQLHVAAAWVKPLIKDADACSWLTHHSATIRLKSAQALPTEELEALSNHYKGNSKSWEAAQLIYTILKSRTLPKEKQMSLVHQILSNLDQISDKQPEHYSLEAHIAVAFIWYAGMGTPEFSGFVARVMKLHKMGIKIDPRALSQIFGLMGGVKLGGTPALMNPTPKQRAQGSQFFRESARQ